MRDDPTVSELGEFGLIDRLVSILGRGRAVVPIGDDAAAIAMGGPDLLLATVDTYLDGVHFRLHTDDLRLVGMRLLAVNVSDIAAMGGTPTASLVSLAVPPGVQASKIEELYRGIRKYSDAHDIDIVGGNVTRTPGPLALDLVQLGRVPGREVVLRSGACVGDVLAVTGTLGNRAAAHILMEAPDDGAGADFVRAHFVPPNRVEAARSLAGRHLVHAMIDISDGLAADVRHLAEASRVGVCIEETALPISDQVRNISKAHDIEPARLALSGGEDYELLLALGEQSLDSACEALEPVKLTPVGWVTARESGLLLRGTDGSEGPLPDVGWRHF